MSALADHTDNARLDPETGGSPKQADTILTLRLRDGALEAGFRCGLWVSLRSPYLPLPATTKG